jgi:hypothetical protein
MPRSIRGFVALALVAVCVPAARATPLAPGSTVTSSASDNVLSTYTGTVKSVSSFGDSLFAVQTSQGLVQGFLSSAVVQTSSPGLDFVYQVIVSSGKGAITDLSVPSFHGVQTDVFQTADHTGLGNINQFTTGTVLIDTFTRSGGPGDNIDVTFSGGGVKAEQSSFLFIIHTNSMPLTNPINGTASVEINGVPITTVKAVVPVPEPGTLALWAGSFCGIVCFFARRRAVLAGAP